MSDGPISTNSNYTSYHKLHNVKSTTLLHEYPNCQMAVKTVNTRANSQNINKLPINQPLLHTVDQCPLTNTKPNNLINAE